MIINLDTLKGRLGRYILVKRVIVTVWLSQQQMAILFDKDRTVIGRHIQNAIKEDEIDPEVVCAKFAHTTQHGAMKGKTQSQEITLYNLDVIISVGYRVKQSSKNNLDIFACLFG